MTQYISHSVRTRLVAYLTFGLLLLSILPAALAYAQEVSGGAGGGGESQSTVTYDVVLEKKISDNIPSTPYAASDFSFQVTGNGVDDIFTLDFGTQDYAKKTIQLAPGVYMLEEIGPSSFVPEDWTVQWSGYGCENSNGPIAPTTLTVTDDISGNICRADNQYRGEPDPISGCTDPEADNYDPAAEEDDGSCEYGDDDILGCTDPLADNYNVDATVDDDSCTYDGGGGNNDDSTWRVYGYVWHDENENTEWDGFQNEEATTTEPDLDGWIVKITNGIVTHSTTTDADGYYEFWVPAGTWTITEEVQNGWTKTFPVVNGHEVVVGSITLAEPASFVATIMDVLVPTAHAQALTTYGPFNFGNFFTGTVNPDGDRDGGGGSSSPVCREFSADRNGGTVTLSWDTSRGSSLFILADGTEVFTTTDDDVVDEGAVEVDYDGDVTYELTVERGNRDDSCTASLGDSDGGRSGQVLGEQVSVVPLGAANAGAGGAAPTPLPTPVPFVAALGGIASRRNGR